MCSLTLRIANAPEPAVVSPAPPRETWRTAWVGPTRWQTRGQIPFLFNAAGLRWDDWRRAGRLKLIKTGPHRSVYRLDSDSGGFFIKHFRIADWRAFAQNLVRPSKARLEWAAAERVAELGIETIDCVAVGEVLWNGLVLDSYLVSRSIPQAPQLDTFLLNDFAHCAPPIQARIRQDLARRMGEMVARLHAAGLEHSDLHAGNLLIRLEPAGSFRLWLIDLHAVRTRSEMTPRTCERNLSLLHQFFAGRSSPTDRRRFWEAYTQTLETLRARIEIGTDAGARRLEQSLMAAAEAGWTRADRAFRRGNRHVRKLDTRETRCRGLAVLNGETMLALRDRPEALFEEYLAAWCKRSGRRRVAAVYPPESLFAGTSAAPATLAVWTPPLEGEVAPRAYVKSVDVGGVWNRFRGMLGESSMRRAWETGHALLRRGIPTPRPLLLIENPDRHYLLTEAIAHSQTLAEFIDHTWKTLAPGQQEAWKRGLLRRGAQLLRQLHASRFDHRDLKFQNILVRSDAESEAVWVLDLDAVRRWPVWTSARSVQNIARLLVSADVRNIFSATDRLRFLKAYLGADERANWKEWWRGITRRSARKLRQNARRRRPVS